MKQQLLLLALGSFQLLCLVLKYKVTANHCPLPHTHKKNLSAGSCLWLDQRFDLCCLVTFHDSCCLSRVGTFAGAPENYFDGSLDSGCHRVTVCLMSPLTSASVAIVKKIWYSCWAVNNTIYPAAWDHHCHWCSPMIKYPLTYLQGWCTLPVSFRVQRDKSVANHGKELSKRWPIWQSQGSLGSNGQLK